MASQKRKSVMINKIRAGDRILIATRINNSVEFVAYTQVGELFQDNRKLHDYYSSRRKLKLKGIKYFSKTIPTSDVAANLEFVVDKSNSSRYFKSE